MERNFDELLKKYEKLLEETESLRKENRILRTKLGIEENTMSTPEAASVSEKPLLKEVLNINRLSSPTEKISLFRSLFKGREDVFARRWYSKSTGKSGYQPVCQNEWDYLLCDKKSFKCSECPNRSLLPITDNDIYRHLSGKDDYCRDVVGIHSMLTDDTCLFLCADFDEQSFKSDVNIYKNTAKQYGIPVYVELSRSGNGAHAWIFFSEPVAAFTARRLGTGILTKAMEIANLSFESYDRFFPNQDTLPKGGFGNLVALPLQGAARRKGNSVFVDESFTPFVDQWEYLANVQKLDAKTIEGFVSVLCKNGELGALAASEAPKPWEGKKQIKLLKDDFPNFIEIVRSNMLYIPVEKLSARAKNAIKRLAAFKNPDFYHAQAMRLPVYNKPRIICTADIFEDFIALPRGYEIGLCEMLKEASVDYNIVDKTIVGNQIAVNFNGELYDEQKPAALALLENNIGVLSATTAFGKTVIAAYIIGMRKTNTLVLVHTQSLMTQWQKSLEEFLDLTPSSDEISKKKQSSPIGVLGSGKNTLTGDVDVAIMQSLITEGEIKEFVRNYGMIIVDECHHVSAVNFEKILKFANAKYVYGLTATPTRQDGQHPIIFAQCGPIRYTVDAKNQAEKRSFEHYLIPRFSACKLEDLEASITGIYKALSENELRNDFIVSDIVNALKLGRTPIVLTERREHVLILEKRLSYYCKNVITLFGRSSQKERREILEQLQKIPKNEPLIIIATGKYVGEGFDYPRLDTLFLALPISWQGKVAQYAGRLHRNYGGKTEVQIYDYVDIHVPVLEKMYQKRL